MKHDVKSVNEERHKHAAESGKGGGGSGSSSGGGSSNKVCIDKKCPPCPACARCPEPAFEKVPNYRMPYVQDQLPMPVLNDFSNFGK